jgi:hypothetical protein
MWPPIYHLGPLLRRYNSLSLSKVCDSARRTELAPNQVDCKGKLLREAENRGYCRAVSRCFGDGSRRFGVLSRTLWVLYGGWAVWRTIAELLSTFLESRFVSNVSIACTRQEAVPGRLRMSQMFLCDPVQRRPFTKIAIAGGRDGRNDVPANHDHADPPPRG